MRKVKIETWKSKMQDGREVDENLLVAINVLIGNKRPEEIPRGIDQFRIMMRISKAFDKAEEIKELTLEEYDYEFLKKMIEKDVPSAWGMNERLSNAIEQFMNANKE